MSKTVEFELITVGGAVGGAGGVTPEDELKIKLNQLIKERPGNWSISTITDIGSYAQRHLFAWLERTED